MGQGEILKLLKKYKKPLTCKQVATKLDKSSSTISSALAKLVKQNEIKKEYKESSWLVPIYSIIREVDDGKI